MRSSITVCLLFVLSGTGFAQDSIKRREVNITSTFKPVLKEAAKINLTATPPAVDSTRPRLQYEIPNQNLALTYQPGSLKPLALQIDTGGRWENYNYAKVGYGSLKTPYFETGLSLGNGKTAGLNIYGRHISSKGKIQFQDFSQTDVQLNGFTQVGKNLEVNARLGSREEKYNKYGFNKALYSFPEDSIKVNFQNFSTRFGLRNIERTELGISYSPEIKLDVFNDRLNNRETNAYFNLPLRKTVGEKFEVDVALEGNITRYSPKGRKALKSNFFAFAPSLLVKTGGVYLQAGIKPSSDNGEFALLPNIIGEFSSNDKRITIQGGWIGYYRPNRYQTLAAYNPWIWAPHFSNNSRIEEIYGGIKGALTDHFSYNVKAGLNKFTNQALFINDTGSGKSFAVLVEPEMKALNVRGEFGYNLGEKFTVHSAIALNRYTGLKVNEKAWGLPPLEFKTSVRLQVIKDLYVKGDLFSFDAPWYQTKNGRGKLQGGMDLSAGVEFAVVKNIKLWAQFNNLTNRAYERWKQYPVYGFNFIGGVVFSFAQQNNQ